VIAVIGRLCPVYYDRVKSGMDSKSNDLENSHSAETVLSTSSSPRCKHALSDHFPEKLFLASSQRVLARI
jgi:hypothetical protein